MLITFAFINDDADLTTLKPDFTVLNNLTDTGVLFVRCRAGISQNPVEFDSIEDLGAAVEATDPDDPDSGG